MRDVAILFIHLLRTLIAVLRPGGVRAVVAESVLLKHQLLVLNRTQRRCPNLRPTDRVVAGLCAFLIHPARLARSAVVLRPSTILAFHRALKNRKYRSLFSSRPRTRPGPKGPSAEIVRAVVEMKRRNPRMGCRHIAQQFSFIFDIHIDKDVIRRILARHPTTDEGNHGPSWLTFLAHTKDSLWSVDLFRCESLTLRTHWVLVVMDLFTRRIIAFQVQPGPIDGSTVCRMFDAAVSRLTTLPRSLTSDHDPLFEYQQWKANLRILEITEIKTVPYAPVSHPFIERLIGTVRREYLDHVPFWNAVDLARKLGTFQRYYNEHRVHCGLQGLTPDYSTRNSRQPIADLADNRWRSHCRGLFQLPAAA